MFDACASLPLSACHSRLWPLCEAWSFRTMQWTNLLSWAVTQQCWVTLCISSHWEWCFFYHSGSPLEWMKCWSNPTCSAKYSCLVQNSHSHKQEKQETSLLGSCKPAYRRRTNVWFKIQVYSCCSMIFAVVVLSILAINSLIWRPTFLQQGFSIQHERSGFSCSFCSQWLHAWGFWKMSSALMAAIWKWETLTS